MNRYIYYLLIKFDFLSGLMEIREPEIKKDFEKYYSLRWKMLRKPWHQPKGSERDIFDEDSIHIMAVDDEIVVGCGRGHFNSKKQAQIRYMAVDERYQRKGIATSILKELEKRLIANEAKEIILKSREIAVPLYEKNGYKVFKKGEILFGEIRHFWMKKNIL